MVSVKRVPSSTARTLEIALAQLSTVVGKVGWFAGHNYPKGGPSVAYVASIHEYGCPEKNIPPRLGMRATADNHHKDWAAIAFQGSKRVIDGKMTAEGLMDLVGLKAAGDMRKRITGPISPPLKPATIARRRARYASTTGGNETTLAHPLTDTKLLLNELTNTVEPAGGEE